MSTHSLLSPSSRYRWQACPGSVKACASYPEGSGSSAAAVEGTHTHTLLEYCLKNSQEPEHYLGTVLADHEGQFSPTRDQCTRVAVALTYIRERMAVINASWVVTEERVDPQLVLGRNDMGGTVDVQLHGPEVLELIDYKDGMNEVEAKDNPQLEQYFFGVVGQMLKMNKLPSFKVVRLTIIQPRIALKGGNPVSFHDYLLDDLLLRSKQIIAEAEATDDPNAPRIPGEKQCRYCVHKVNCSEFTSWNLDKAGVKFGAIHKVEEQSAPKMSNEKLRELIESGPLLRKLLEEAEEEAIRRISAGQPVPGLKVVTGPGRRSWAFDDEQMAAKLKRFGLPKGVLWKTTLISPAQIEKAKWEKRDGTTVQLTPKQLKLVETELVKKSNGKLTCVPESDSRPGLEYGDIHAMFKPSPEPVVPAVPDWLR